MELVEVEEVGVVALVVVELDSRRIRSRRSFGVACLVGRGMEIVLVLVRRRDSCVGCRLETRTRLLLILAGFRC